MKRIIGRAVLLVVFAAVAARSLPAEERFFIAPTVEVSLFSVEKAAFGAELAFSAGEVFLHRTRPAGGVSVYRRDGDFRGVSVLGGGELLPRTKQMKEPQTKRTKHNPLKRIMTDFWFRIYILSVLVCVCPWLKFFIVLGGTDERIGEKAFSCYLCCGRFCGLWKPLDETHYGVSL
jgi:hypothetical protein